MRRINTLGSPAQIVGVAKCKKHENVHERGQHQHVLRVSREAFSKRNCLYCKSRKSLVCCSTQLVSSLTAESGLVRLSQAYLVRLSQAGYCYLHYLAKRDQRMKDLAVDKGCYEENGYGGDASNFDEETALKGCKCQMSAFQKSAQSQRKIQKNENMKSNIHVICIIQNNIIHVTCTVHRYRYIHVHLHITTYQSTRRVQT